jgi:transcriptional adapter 3
MPSVSSKGKPKPSSKASGAPRSRNTTPLPPGNPRVSAEPSASAAYLKSPMTSLTQDYDVSIEELLDRVGSVTQIPSGALLNSTRETVQLRPLKHAKNRCNETDKLLRELQRMRSQRQRPAHDRERDRERERPGDKDADDRRPRLKKVKKREPDEERPLAVGAHAVARQDGVDLHKGE